MNAPEAAQEAADGLEGAYYNDEQATFWLGDCREVLRSLPDESVQCVVTSPPYWSLRDYGVEPSVWGGDTECEHEWDATPAKEAYTGTTRWQHVANGRGELQDARASELGRSVDHKRIREANPGTWGSVTQGSFCGRCGAWRGALGLEPTPEAYVAAIVEVFREVRRVLAKDGTLWLNLGDSYAGYWGDKYAHKPFGKDRTPDASTPPHKPSLNLREPGGLKPKDLVGIPWMVAFALRADGWWLRQDIIWAKPNPMPESVRDRCTKAHEYLFLLSKSERYYYDGDAIREERQGTTHSRGIRRDPPIEHAGIGHRGWTASMTRDDELENRNKRSVWTVATAPFPEAHFATFPPDLVKPCILAGCPEGGVVLDPFIGSGTTAMVAKSLGRKAWGIDAKAEYLEMAKRRCAQMGLFV